MENFTPQSALIGGVLIGLASTMLLWLNGRVAGISGIVGALIPPARGDVRWRLLFALGLVLGAAVYGSRRVRTASPSSSTRSTHADRRWAPGRFRHTAGRRCTSGHGVCGIARMSPRSIVATAVFMVVAGATVFIARHTIGG